MKLTNLKLQIPRLMSIVTGVCLGINVQAVAQSTPDYDLAPVSYSTSKDGNTITRLQLAIEAGKRALPGSTGQQILKALLDELKVPVSSQMLVFSKTSLQRELISPVNPRAVYFNRDFYVGYVPGGLIEIIACDDPKGMMFYSLDPNEPSEKRKFVRSLECMTCHSSSNTMGVPGVLCALFFRKKTASHCSPGARH